MSILCGGLSSSRRSILFSDPGGTDSKDGGPRKSFAINPANDQNQMFAYEMYYFHRPRVRDKAAVAIIGRNSSPGSFRSSSTKFKMSSAMIIKVICRLENITLPLKTLLSDDRVFLIYSVSSVLSYLFSIMRIKPVTCGQIITLLQNYFSLVIFCHRISLLVDMRHPRLCHPCPGIISSVC